MERLSVFLWSGILVTSQKFVSFWDHILFCPTACVKYYGYSLSLFYFDCLYLPCLCKNLFQMYSFFHLLYFNCMWTPLNLQLHLVLMKSQKFFEGLFILRIVQVQQCLGWGYASCTWSSKVQLGRLVNLTKHKKKILDQTMFISQSCHIEQHWTF